LCLLRWPRSKTPARTLATTGSRYTLHMSEPSWAQPEGDPPFLAPPQAPSAPVWIDSSSTAAGSPLQRRSLDRKQEHESESSDSDVQPAAGAGDEGGKGSAVEYSLDSLTLRFFSPLCSTSPAQRKVAVEEMCAFILRSADAGSEVSHNVTAIV
jgi:hypothetical protein